MTFTGPVRCAITPSQYLEGVKGLLRVCFNCMAHFFALLRWILVPRISKTSRHNEKTRLAKSRDWLGPGPSRARRARFLLLKRGRASPPLFLPLIPNLCLRLASLAENECCLTAASSKFQQTSCIIVSDLDSVYSVILTLM